jgi:hypothetical protein
MGKSIRISFDILDNGSRSQSLLVDFRIHYVKANGGTSPKVFKLKTIELGDGDTVRLGKTVSLKQMTTRKHYPGLHTVELLVNGVAFPLGEFHLS